MTHEEYKEMLATHALGALAANETRALEEHLSTCAECRAELAHWHDTAAALAFSATLVEPSSALRSRLLEKIRATAVIESQTPAAAERRAAVSEAGATPASSAPTNVIPITERARNRWSAAQRFGALAASVAFIAFLVALVALWNRNRSMQGEMARLNRDLQTTQEQLQRAQEKAEMLTAPDTKMATLSGTAMAPRAHAMLAYNAAGKAMMIVNNLPPAPAGKDYQIWFITNGKPVPGGVFKPDATGHAEMRDQLPAQAQSASAFAVTLEPQGGTQAPTGQQYLLSTASS